MKKNILFPGILIFLSFFCQAQQQGIVYSYNNAGLRYLRAPGPAPSGGIQNRIGHHSDQETTKEESKEDGSIQINPNPSSGKFLLSVSLESAVNKIEVYNVLGERVYVTSTPVSTWREAGGKVTIDLSNHSPGIYLVQAQTAEKMLRKKIVLE